MKIFILEPTGQKSYELFSTMVETFMSQGHIFIEKAVDADVIFYDLWNVGGIYCKRDVETILFWQKPVVVFDFKDQWGSPQHRPNWWGFDENKILGEKCSDGQRWAVHLKQLLDAGLVKLCFVRKMAKGWGYPDWVRPIECCIWPGHDFEPASRDDYVNRPHDACFIGNATPWRANAVGTLIKFGFDVRFFFPYFRMEHDEWLQEHRYSKTFIEADGGGFGSERIYQLATISAQLRIRNEQRMAYPWTDGVNCLEVGSWMGCVSEIGENELLRQRLNDHDFMYSIYMNGVKHLHAYYTPEARSRYVLEQMATVGLR
jgi:hypothetical protein